MDGRIAQRVAWLLMAFALILGCAHVRPWDRDLLAQDKMQFVADPAGHAVDEKIYFSKEASSGGTGVGGGGCGCN